MSSMTPRTPWESDQAPWVKIVRLSLPSAINTCCTLLYIAIKIICKIRCCKIHKNNIIIIHMYKASIIIQYSKHRTIKAYTYGNLLSLLFKHLNLISCITFFFWQCRHIQCYFHSKLVSKFGSTSFCNQLCLTPTPPLFSFFGWGTPHAAIYDRKLYSNLTS